MGCASSLALVPGAGEGAGPPPPLWPALPTGLHRLAYTEWGDADAPDTLVAVHGFTRNGRDFDALAEALTAPTGSTRRVIAPDLPGRGRSDWLALPNADRGYNLWQYLLDATTLIARLDIDGVDWLGTSMGGLVGMLVAGQPGSPIRRLVLNDVGPVVSGDFLAQLASYVTTDPDFSSVAEIETYLRGLYPGFGALTDPQWRHLAEHSVRPGDDGRLRLAFDPAIGAALTPPFADVDLRPFWAAVTCPVLVLRGESSPALPADLAAEMTRTGPKATVVEIAGCGHAPPLMSADQIAVVANWLADTA
jgi:pimeloyl-ACP methyl ester carboxylesterase